MVADGRWPLSQDTKPLASQNFSQNGLFSCCTSHCCYLKGGIYALRLFGCHELRSNLTVSAIRRKEHMESVDLDFSFSKMPFTLIVDLAINCCSRSTDFRNPLMTPTCHPRLSDTHDLTPITVCFGSPLDVMVSVELPLTIRTAHSDNYLTSTLLSQEDTYLPRLTQPHV